VSNIIEKDNIVKAELDRHVSFISEMDGVIQIYLFGSYAYGTPTTDSDLDLLVIVEDGIDPIKTIREIKRGLNKGTVSVDILTINKTDFDERSKPDRVTLQREIKNKGILLYGEQ